MTPEEARAVVAELVRRAEVRQPSFLRDVHEAQRRLLSDKSRWKAALCSRRAGKTTVALLGLAETATRHAGARVAYMGLTYPSAMNLAWKPLKELSRKYKLGWKFNKVDRIIFLPNGSEIFIFAGDKSEDVDKIRGLAFHRFVIDECASYGPHFADLIRKVIQPALGDFQGDLWLIGTPGDVPAGYFYEATQPKEKRKPGFKKWSLHHWTVLENPYFEEKSGVSAEEWIRQEMEENGYAEDDPIFQQEYRGRWAPNTDKLVYAFREDRNLVDEVPFPLRSMTLVLGLDFGVVDGFARVVLAYHYSSPITYVIRAAVETGLAPSQGVERIRELQEELFEAMHGRRAVDEADLDSVFDYIVADTEGQGKAWTQELAIRTGLFVEPAEKQAKRAFIDHINSDYRTGRLVYVRSETLPLQAEVIRLPWKDEFRLVEHKQYPNHVCDAKLYAWRRTRAYDARSDETHPDPGSSEWYEQQERQEEEREAHREEVRARARKRSVDARSDDADVYAAEFGDDEDDAERDALW